MLDDIPIRLERLRRERNYTQLDVAEKLGINRTTYASYETRKSTPPTDVLMRIADLYHVSCDYLLGRTTERRSTADEIGARLNLLSAMCADKQTGARVEYTELLDLVNALIAYHRTSMRAEGEPVACAHQVLSALTDVVRAASGDSLSALHIATNDLSVTALNTTAAIITEYIR